MSAILPTVLVVDDDELVLTTMRRALRGRGWRVLGTSDPTEALDLIEREAVDVLLSDIDMPRLSGIELAARARARFPDVARILITGRGTLQSALRAINEGEVFRYLEKPFDLDELRATVAAALARRAELARVAAADRAAASRRERLAELERAQPGISAVPAPDGAYELDEDRLDGIAARLAPGELRALLLGAPRIPSP